MGVTPPIEDRLLGGLIDGVDNHPQVTVPLLGVLTPRHFSRESNRAVFAAIRALHAQGRAVDLVELYRYFCASGQVSKVVTAVDLADLWSVRCNPDEVGVLAEQLIRGRA